MKVKKLIISLLLVASMLMCSCKQPENVGGDSSASGTTPTVNGVVEESTELTHYIEGTLHNVRVDFDAPVADFVVNRTTNYKIVNGITTGNKNPNLAAAFLVEHVFKATGASMDIIETSELNINDINTNTNYIFVGCEDTYQKIVGAMPSYDILGVSGYQIQTYGKNVFINGYHQKGYQMGAIAFLREVLGYDMFSEDCVIYEKDGKRMPSMDIVERPDIDYRHTNSALTPIELMGMGFETTTPLIEPNNSFCHNWHEFVTNADWMAHPEWRSPDESGWQPCWTARGNQESYTLLINHLFEKVKGFMKVQPNRDAIIIGQNDIGPGTPQIDRCSCTSCRASYEYYGTMAGAWLSLCNRVSLKVDEWLKTEEAIRIFGENKKCYILALIYHASLNPPVEKKDGAYVLENGAPLPKKEVWFNSDGTMVDWNTAWVDSETGNSKEEKLLADWTALHERIYSAPSVNFMFAGSQAYYTHSFYEEENSTFTKMIEGWKALGGEFYFWFYTLSSVSLLYPYNSWDSLFETTRYAKETGAKYVYWQGQYNNKGNPSFDKLRYYLTSKVEFDVNSNYKYYLDKYFKNYFGAASDKMYAFFQELTAQCRYIEEVNGVTPTHGNSRLMNSDNWPKQMLQRWMTMISEAYEIIEQEYKVTAPEKYEMYKKHIMIEELFPLYVLCKDYAESFAPSTLKEMRLTFINNFYALGNTAHKESALGGDGLMTFVTDTWDLD